MAYFVTGATGFIGRHLVQELVDHRDGTIFVLCRESSAGPDGVPHPGLGLGPGGPRHRRPGDGPARRGRRLGRRAPRRHRPLLPPRRDLRHDRRRRDQREAERRRHPERPRARRRAAGGHLPPGVVGGRGRRLPRHLRRVDVRRGAAPALAVPPHEVRVREDRPQRGDGPVAGLPARDRGRPLRDRRDGQGRRPLLLLPADEADAGQPAGLAAAGRRRPRRHQRGAGRLRREGDGPPRPPARPRRRGVPPGQPRPAAGRRHGQRVLQGRRRADVRDAHGPADHRRPSDCSPARCGP